MTEPTQLSPSRPHRFNTAVAFGMTDVGLVRRANEDNFLIDESLGVVMVGDGMGGHVGGEIASAQALISVRDFLFKHIAQVHDAERTIPARSTCTREAAAAIDSDATQTDLSMPAVLVLFDAIEHANRYLLRLNQALNQPEGSGMGTTLTGFWHLPDQAIIVVFHVGDSRLYRYRDGELALLTRDQTLYQQAIESGDVMKLPPRNLLLQAIGPSTSLKPDVHAFPLLPGDLFMLCSDGLHASIPFAEIETLLTDVNAESLEANCARLIATAKQNGSRDNITALLVHYDN